jgi:hypothetical protein
MIPLSERAMSGLRAGKWLHCGGLRRAKKPQQQSRRFALEPSNPLPREDAMSVDLHEEAGGKILIVKLSDKLTKQDYEHFLPVVDRLVKQYGKLRLLVEMHNFHGWTMSALWEDLKFDVKHFKDIERLALVGESKWEAGMAAFCKPFTTAKIKYFDESQKAAASTWIHAVEPA